jgi:uncharacterized protein YjbI with pentapeptide repeats
MKHAEWLRNGGIVDSKLATDARKANLREADLGGANLSKTDWDGADLPRAHLDGAQLPDRM